MPNVIFLIILNIGVLFSFNVAVAYVGPGIGITLLSSLGIYCYFRLVNCGHIVLAYSPIFADIKRKVRQVSK